MASIEIVLPIPPKELHPNERAHFHAKARMTGNYRYAAKVMAISAMNARRWPRPPRWKTATVRAVFRFPTNRRRDKDNLLASLKAAFDGLADSDLIENDSGLTFLPVEVVIDAKRPPQVTLFLRRNDG